MAFARKQKSALPIMPLIKSLAPLVIGAATVFLFFALLSFNANDPSWFTQCSAQTPVQNWCGAAGAHLAALFIYLFGGWSIMIPPLLVASIFFTQCADRIIGAILFVFVGTAWSAHYHIDAPRITPGGLIGMSLHAKEALWFDAIGSFIVLHTLLLIAILLMTRITPLLLFQTIYAWGKKIGKRDAQVQKASDNPALASSSRFLVAWAFVTHSYSYIQQSVQCIIRLIYAAATWFIELLKGKPVEQAPTSIFSFEAAHAQDVTLDPHDDYWRVADALHSVSSDIQTDAPIAEQPAIHEMKAIPAATRAAQLEPTLEPIKEMQPLSPQEYQLPDTNSLFGATEQHAEDKRHQAFLKERAQLLEEKLERFGITGKVTTIKPGPVVTMFEYKPAIDTKLSKIITLEDDLALALQAISIRIIAPIPGTAFVGFEVANQQRTPVLLQQLLCSTEFKQTNASVPLVLGVNTTGAPIIADLTRMPHLLIAGSTGSGKSVALHAILMSMLCQKKPNELKLMLIDPKRLEFTNYADIGHLLTPVITDPRVAICALRWAIRAMEERYTLMARAKVRNIAEYNELIARTQAKPQEISLDSDAREASRPEPLPYLVIIIDELADLMMTAGNDIEEAITRLSQMARAAGIHLIVATQRPSVDVITGLIKVNFPSRIALRVTSKIDSRTIIDSVGAEKLLGRGDQLFMDAQHAVTTRIHGAYVGDKEINAVVDSIKRQGAPHYLDLGAVVAAGEQTNLNEEDDEIFQDILLFLDEVDEISISLLQRRFKIGYNRSARIMEVLTTMGKIMPADGSKLRKVVKQANS